MSHTLVAILSDASIYWGVPLGLWVSFRVLGYPDLSVEQLFVLGGGVLAIVLSRGHGVAMLIPVMIGIAIVLGMGCSFVRNRFKVHPILISLAAGYAYYSVSLALLGGPNLYFGVAVQGHTSGVVAGVAFGGFALLSLLLHHGGKSTGGMRVVASGSNAELAKRHGISIIVWQGVGLSISFALIMMAGALYAWRASNIDVAYGGGLLLISIFVVVLTRALQARVSLWRNSGLILGLTAVYLSVLTIALQLGMPPQWLRGANALALLALVLLLPKGKGDMLRI